MTPVLIQGVPVVHWNPRRRMFAGKLGDYVKRPSRTNNFGDMITPLLVERMAPEKAEAAQPATNARLLAIGSIMHFAEDGDVVWGTGVNGKTPETSYHARRLSVRAVRGPHTRDFLIGRGIDAPAVYGDPALLLPRVVPELAAWARNPVHDVAVVPNLNDYSRYPHSPDVVNPRAPLMSVLERIATSRLVVGSSLHGIVIAEALGIPARLVMPKHEHPLKYEDYYLGTGRSGINAAKDLAEALEDGTGSPSIDFDGDALEAAFPHDLWDPAIAS